MQGFLREQDIVPHHESTLETQYRKGGCQRSELARKRLAFFSGTDERDDRSSICYSGVIGKLDTPTPAFKFRFNSQEKKYDVQITDIFSDEQVQVPAEWLDKVSVLGTQYNGGYYGGNWGNYAGRRGNARYAAGFDDDDDAQRELLRQFYMENDEGIHGSGTSHAAGQNLNRRERRADNKRMVRNQKAVENVARFPQLGHLPKFSNPALKHLKQFEFETTFEDSQELDDEILKACPEYINHIPNFTSSAYPTLATTAIFALIGGLSEDFYLPSVSSKANKIVHAYEEKSGKTQDYNFITVYKEFVVRPFFNRLSITLKRAPTDMEINAAVTATVEDAWAFFSAIQLS